MRTFKSVLSLAAALVLSACGGGATLGDGGGGGLGGGGGGTTGPSSTPASVVLLSNRQQLSADADTATEGATLTAIVTDRNGIAVSNAPVTFSVVSGAGALIISSGTTGADGTATAILTTGGNASFPRSIEVRARAGSAQSELRSIAVVDPNSVSAVPNVSLAASSNRLDPNADSTAAGVTLTATVRNPDGTPASNVRVNFNQASTSGGLISPSEGRTNGAGQIQAVLTTGGDPSPRSIVITAQVTNLTDGSGGAESVPVTIQVRSTQTATSVGLSANRNVLSPTANSPDQGITVTATVAGPNGQALVGVPVTFSASGVVLQVTQAVTDGSGRATAIATAGGNATPRTATVTASADGVNSSPLAIQVRSAASLTLTSTSDQLSPRAETPAQGIVFTATLRDASGTPLPNVQVQFIAEGGQIQVTRGVTDAAGTATAVLTTGGDPSPRTILVTAGATDGGQILEATRSISVVEQAAGVVVLAASPDLQSNVSVPANGVRITAVVRDSNNTLVQNAAVQFSTVSGGGALQVTRGITDVTGTAEALLSTGGDPTVRPITVRAQSGASSGTVSVQVVGSQVTINAPQAASVGVAETIVVSVRDSGNAVVANRPVTLSSTALLGTINGSSGSATVNSNAQGVATFTYLPTANGDERLTATAIGVSAQTPTIRIGGVTLTLAFNPGTPTEFNFGTVANVVATLRENGVAVSGETLQLSTTRGMLSAASGVTAPPGPTAGQLPFTIQSNGADGAGEFLITAVAPGKGGVSATLRGEFVAINPASVNVQAEPAKIGLNSSSTIRAVVRDAQNNLVKNARVDFTLSDPTGGSLSAATGLTNSQGAVSVTYRSSSTSSATNGVRITARVAGVPNSTTSLTVGGTALRITLGTGNEIFENSTTTYRLPYTAIITDAAGNPAPPSTVFRLKIRPLEYQKGFYAEDPITGELGIVYRVPRPPAVPDPLLGAREFGCRSEDANSNGILDPGEDDNLNFILDPGNIATVPETVPLDANGIAEFGIVYPQDRGNWVLVELSATASVDGSESLEVRNFVLPISAEDFEEGNPPGDPSPYGTSTSCANAN